MNLKGHSKFNLKLIKSKQGYFVQKSNGKRLLKQCIKQYNFINKINEHPILFYLFEVPNVKNLNWDGQHFSFIMNFYNGKSILDILEVGDITLLDNLIDRLFLYLKWEFDNTLKKDMAKEIQDKLLTLVYIIKNKKVQSIINKLINQLDFQVYIPIGHCHGDFTFSNMIFTNKIILIDFLDAFIESPIQDCAKLLQSVNLQWELLLDGGKGRDITKIKLGYGYLRQQIMKKMIEEFPNYLKLINLFYMITLLRIIPYITNKNIYDIVIQKLEKFKK